MPYYLRHYFDPDFRHLSRTPKEVGVGFTSLYYLGYVQNVVKGQVLAEVIDLPGEGPYEFLYDKRFIYPERRFPCGPNCAPHPSNPDRIIATANGYVFYHEGLITVKKLLNVRGDVDFSTGNILFAGDVVVHGAVKPGFALKANNVLVKDLVDGGTIKAQGDVVCESGVYGSEGSVLRVDGDLRLKFCENARLSVKGNLIIEESCLHSSIYAGGNVVVRGTLRGGEMYANRTVYVGERLGGTESITRIFMGYDPFEDLAIRQLGDKREALRAQIQRLKVLMDTDPEHRAEHEARLALAKGRRELVRGRQQELMEKFKMDETRGERCRLIVSGRADNNLELSIGQHVLRTDRGYTNAEFRLMGGDVAVLANTTTLKL